jgi:ketosteroid isomerase-like protein
MRAALEVVEEFFARGRTADASSLLAHDVEFLPLTREPAFGPDGFERSLEDLAAQFRDYDVWPGELVRHGRDTVIAVLNRRGITHRSDVPIEDRFAQVFTVEDGRITRIQSFKTLEDARSAPPSHRSVQKQSSV